MMPKVLAVIMLAMATGCVSASKYKELEARKAQEDQSTSQAMSAQKKQYDEALAINQNANEKIKAQETMIANLENKLGVASSDKSKLAEQLQTTKKALEEMAARKAERDRRIQEFRDLTSRFQSLIQSDQLSVQIVDGRMVVTLGSDVLFPSGSSKLSAEGTKAIQTVAQTLSTIPKRTYQVEGHTDNVPIRTALFPSNWELAAARAISVSRTMVDAGLDASRVSAASFGEFKPVKPNDSPEGRTQNRRIEIVIVPDLSLLPGHDELSRIKSAE